MDPVGGRVAERGLWGKRQVAQEALYTVSMLLLRVFLPVLVLSICVLIPFSAEAANASFFGPIIQQGCHCVNSAPDWGCVLDAIHNVFNLIFSLSVLVFALTAAYSGILFMTSVTNAENKSKAKSMLLNTVVGLAIALSAWLMVDFVMRVLYNENAGWGPWNRILAVDSARRCLAPQEPPQQNTGGGGGVDEPEVVEEGDVSVGDRVECNRGSGGEYEPGEITAATTGQDGSVRVSVEYDDGQTEQNIPADRCRPLGGETGDGQTMRHSCTGTTGSGPNAGTPKQDLSCENCVRLSEEGFTCSSDSECHLQSSVAAKVEGISFAGDWVITEGFPPSYCEHRNSCHYTGTCIDVDILNYNGSNAAHFITAARNVGLNPVLEVPDAATCNTMKSRGVDERYLFILPGTRNHFSVYSHSVGAQSGCD